MAELKTRILLELQDKISGSLKKITESTGKLTIAGTKLGNSFNKQSGYIAKALRVLGNYEAKMRLVAIKTKELENINKQFSKQKGSILGLAATGMALAAPLKVTRQRELLGAKLKTVLPNEGRNENLALSEGSARGFARSGLSSYEDLLNIEYNLNSAGLGEKVSREGASAVAKVAKITGGVGDEVAAIMATARNNFGNEMDEIGDILTKTQLKFQIANFGQLGEGMKMAAGAALAMKVPFGDASAAVGMLNNAGLQGSMAGTSLSAVLREIIPASQKLGKVWDGDLAGFMENLNSKLEGMSDNDKYLSLKKIFGSDEAIKAVSLLLPKAKQMRAEFDDVGKNSKGIVDKEILEFTQLLDTNLKKLFESIAQLADSIGKALLPIINPLISGLASVLGFIADISLKVPWLSTLIYGAIFAVIGLAMAMKIYTLASLGAKGITTSFSLAILKNTLFLKIWRGALMLTAFSINVVKNAFNVLKLAMASNPLGIALLAISTLAMLVIMNWETVKGWFSSFFDWLENTSFFKFIDKGVKLAKSIFTSEESNIKVSNDGVNKVKEASMIGGSNSTSANTNNNQTYNVNITGGNNPVDTAKEVSKELSRAEQLSMVGG